MRIRPIAVAGAVTLSYGLVVIGGGTAGAASHALTVTALDRTGASVTADVHLVNVSNGREYDVVTGRAKSVPAGTYSVATPIRGADDTVTLAVRVVTVKAATKVAFDARKGNRVGFGVDDATAETRTLQLVPLVKTASDGYWWALNPIQDELPAGRTYVIPSTSKYLSLFSYARLEKQGADPSPYRIDLTRRYDGGMPADVSFYSKRSSLARVDVTVRSSGPGERGSLTLRPATASTGTYPAAGTTEFPALPAKIVTYRSPRLWDTSFSATGTSGSGGGRVYYDQRPSYAAGKTYTEYYRAGAWNPQVSTGIDGRYLDVWPRTVMASPRVGGGWLGAGGGKDVKLYKGSTLIASGTGADMRVKLSTTAAWYTLRLTAKRRSADGLSGQVAASWRFKARGYSDGFTHGGARIFTAKFAPAGLDWRNTAARGTTTTIPTSITGSGVKGKMKSLKVEASFDGGATWKRVGAAWTGSKYTVKVPNPNAAGHVSLRVTAVEAKGAGLTQTILNAYGVR